MKKTISMSVRVMCLVIGSLFMALGSQLAVGSLFGADIVVLTLEGLVHLFQFSMGTASLIFSIVFLLITFVYGKQYIGFGTVAGIFLQSMMLNWFDFTHFQHGGLILRLMAMFLGIIIISIGCAVYALAKLGVGPYVGAILALHDRTGMSVSRVKFRIDIACLVVAVLMGVFPSLGPLVGLVISGPIMDASMKAFVFLENLVKNKVWNKTVSTTLDM